MVAGRRARRKAPAWKSGDRVQCEFDGIGTIGGTISKIDKRKKHALVEFDDGDSLEVALVSLAKGPPAPEVIEQEEDDTDPTGRGFNQYCVHWDDDQLRFHFKVEGIKFYGEWRLTRCQNQRVLAWAIDIWAERDDHHYCVESIPYLSGDPREDMKSLDADICAAVNKWFYRRCKGNAETLDDLRKRAENPTVTITHLETLDRIILRLKETRDTAIRAGGTRWFQIVGDKYEEEPRPRLRITLTEQAVAAKGKVPSLYEGAVFDGVKGGRTAPIAQKPDESNVQALVERLLETKDKGEARKIRGVLRKMGHRGGARALAKKFGAANAKSKEQG